MQRVLQRILHPREWFAATKQTDVRLLPCGAQVLQERDRTEAPASVIDQSHELPSVCLSTQVDNATQAGVIVIGLTNLNPLHATARSINHILVGLDGPLLGGEVLFDSGIQNPVANILAAGDVFANLIDPADFVAGEIQLWPVRCRTQRSLQLFAKEGGVGFNKCHRCLIRTVDLRVFHLNSRHPRLVIRDRRDVRIVLPDVPYGSPDIGEVFSRVLVMEREDGSC